MNEKEQAKLTLRAINEKLQFLRSPSMTPVSWQSAKLTLELEKKHLTALLEIM